MTGYHRARTLEHPDWRACRTLSALCSSETHPPHHRFHTITFTSTLHSILAALLGEPSKEYQKTEEVKTYRGKPPLTRLPPP